jgi:hypothetical protein
MSAPRSRVAEPGLAGLTQALIDLLSEFGDAKEKWGRTDGKLDTFIEQLKVQDDRANKLEARVRRIENTQHWWGGIGAGIGTLLGFGASKLHLP